MSVNPLVKYEIAIQQYYSKYKTFVNDNSLPKLIVKFHNGKNENIDYLAQMEAEDLYNQRYILHFDYMLFAIMDNTEIASILFHEFTHLTDSLSLRVLPYAKFKTVMQLYSEIHAYEIELGRALDLQFKRLMDNHLMTTGYYFDGYRIKGYNGVISGSVVLGTGFLSEFGASISDLFGSQSELFSDKLETARELALKNLVKKSAQNSGNAIIGIDFDYITFSNNMIGVVANGTSVVVEKIEQGEG